MSVTSTSRFFRYPWLQNFIAACRKIETNPNYQPYKETKELFPFVVNKYGRAKQAPARCAYFIQPSYIAAIDNEGQSLGALYQIVIAEKTQTEDQEYRVWAINYALVLLVTRNGEYQIFFHDKALLGDFNTPLTHIDPQVFLNPNPEPPTLLTSQPQ